jgi:multidrug resistance efflux pump
VLFELESEKQELNTENARLAYQLSQGNSLYIKDKIAEMELKVQSAKDKLTLDESIYNRNNKIRSLKVSELTLKIRRLKAQSSIMSRLKATGTTKSTIEE